MTCSRCGEKYDPSGNAMGVFGGHSPNECIEALKKSRDHHKETARLFEQAFRDIRSWLPSSVGVPPSYINAMNHKKGKHPMRGVTAQEVLIDEPSEIKKVLRDLAEMKDDPNGDETKD